jgi:hypothetical protein
MKSSKDKGNKYKFSCIISIGTNKIVSVKAKYDKLDKENKIIILNEMMWWVRQQLNDIQPEQE